MKGYRHTELGWIPEDWQLNKLGNLSEKIGSGITPRGGEKVYTKSGRPFLRSQNVGWGTLILSDIVFIDDETHGTFKSTEIRKGDVFLNITGASIGRSAIASKELVGGNVNQHVCVIRTKKDCLDPKFLNAFLISNIGQNIILSYQAGGNRQGLNYEQIKSFQIPLPPLSEQKQIVLILTAWDKTIEDLTSLIVTKQQLKKVLMQQLLTGKKRLPGFTGKWESIDFGKVFDFVKTESYSREDLVSTADNSSIHYIHYGDIHVLYVGDHLDLQVENRVPSLQKNIEVKNGFEFLRDGDLIIADASEDYEGVGECIEITNIGKKKVIGGLHTIVARDNKGLTVSGYRTFLLKNPDVSLMLKKLAVGISVYGISKSSLSGLKIQLPSLEEQKAIASVLIKIEKDIQLLNLQLNFYKVQKKGLMQLLLTGKKRVKV